MPMQRHLYPHEWDEVALAIKEACDWQCQMCGKQCRRPGEPHETQRSTLTVAHWDHIYDEPTIFVVALCAPCHLRHDIEFHRQQRRRNRYKNHMTLFRLKEPPLSREELAEFEAAWPPMPDLEGGVDLFAEKYGPPTGEENDTDLTDD